MVSILRPFFHIFWVATFLIIWSAWPTSGLKMMKEYFPELDDDLTKVTWVHGANSRKQLEDALNGPAMMIEADILMGKKHGSQDDIPIMAHPPVSTSDLGFDEFLDMVIKAVNVDMKKKGVKLDFKDINAVKPVLKRIKEIKEKAKKFPSLKLGFPVWLNADIFENGPVDAVTKPLNQTEFLGNMTKTSYYNTLSVGWTTRFYMDDAQVQGTDKSSVKPITKGKYTKEMFQNAWKTLNAAKIDFRKVGVTFPLRAAIAVQSVDEIFNYLIGEGGPKTTITLWSPVDEPVDHDRLRHLITVVGKNRVYTDFPFTFSLDDDNDSATTRKVSSTSESPKNSVDDNEPEPKDDAIVNKATTVSVSTSVISSLLTIGLALVLKM